MEDSKINDPKMNPPDNTQEKKYLVHDPFDGDYEEFGTIQEARNFIYDQIDACVKDGEGIPLDAEGFVIYEAKEQLHLEEIADKKDCTDEEWEEMGLRYSDQFDIIVNPKIKEM
jgi:hypothetical protein